MTNQQNNLWSQMSQGVNNMNTQVQGGLNQGMNAFGGMGQQGMNMMGQGMNTMGTLGQQGMNTMGGLGQQGMNMMGQGMNTVKNTGQQGLNTMGQMGQQGMNTMGSLGQQGMNMMGQGMNTVKNTGQQGLNTMGNMGQQGMNTVGQVGKQGVNMVGQGMNTVKNTGQQGLNTIGQVGQQGMNTVGQVGKQGVNMVGQGMNTVKNTGQQGLNTIGQVGQQGMNTVGQVGQQGMNMVGQGMNTVKNTGQQVLQGTQNLGQTVGTGIKTGGQQVLNSNVVQNAGNNIQSGINNVGTGAKVVGKGLSTGVGIVGTGMGVVGTGIQTGIKNVSSSFDTTSLEISQFAHATFNDFSGFFQSENFQDAVKIDFSDVGDAYTMTKSNLIFLTLQLAGVAKWAFDFVKFDIFRDFFQIVALFLNSIATIIPKSFINFWGRIASAVAVSFKYIKTTPLLWFWLTFVFVWISLILLKRKSQSDPDKLRDGHEVRIWEDRSKTERFSAQIFLTILISLYLPISRNCLEIITCYGKENDYIDEFEKRGGCWGTTHLIHAFFAALTMIGVTFYVPWLAYKLIKKNKPIPIEFDDEGNEKVYTDKDYESDLDKDKCPYKFLYKGYERKWAFYKVIVMVIKLLLIIPAVLLLNQVASITVTMVILFIFAILSFVTAPFIKNADDHIDQSARITTLFTVVVAFVLAVMSSKQRDNSEDDLGFALSIAHWANIGIMVFLTLLTLGWFKKKWKNMTGRLDFSDDLDYDLKRERKFRIWHPFWEGLFHSDPKYENILQRLHVEKKIAAQFGVESYQEGLIPVSKEAMLERMFAQKYLEGVDVYWDGMDPNTLRVDSKTCFGKMWIDPFPFKAIIVYDDANPVVLEDEDILTMCRMNRDPEIVAKRDIRMQLRALNGQQVFFKHTETHTKSVGSGNNKKSARVEFTFNYGKLKIKANQKLTCSAGFKVSIHYKDGEGTYQGKTFRNETATIGHSTIGILDDFVLTDELKRLLQHDENARLIEENLPTVKEEYQSYRDGLLEQRLSQTEILSWGFWFFVYNNDCLQRDYLEDYLVNFEIDEHVSQIPEEHENGLNYIYGKLQFYDSHPACSYWYCFWDDLWSHNHWMKKFKGHEEFLSPRYPTCICYRPLNKEDLEDELKEHGLKKKIKKKIIKKLYEMIDFYSEEDRSEFISHQMITPGTDYVEFQEFTYEKLGGEVQTMGADIF
ncbi:g protein-coupled receptor-related [Anaeramoeba flamelloides]|uniref:G protein-coupled receptor-related n=1 Tax=Anaeramoeba flamelloides TaxID=1746091 RepID=A0AAV7Z7L2_9EUKA|nr:g protein-coupled receptor-related [Anaeramoeba flamelloides]